MRQTISGRQRVVTIHRAIAALLLAASMAPTCRADEPAKTPGRHPASDQVAFKQFIESHCIECHDKTPNTAGLALDELLATDVGANREPWEKVVRKLTARQMPPGESPRPEEREYEAAISWLASLLDAAAAAHPDPGRTETFRRLNRTEYRNAIRDLLALDVDVAALLPPDESSHGFDNITVSDLSPTLLNRYLSAAQKISGLAVGRGPRAPREETFRVRPDVTQDSPVEGCADRHAWRHLRSLHLSAGRRI